MTATAADGPRQLIVCCDGTNNTLTGGRNDTHVLQLLQHLNAHPQPGRVVFYDPGVGVPDRSPPTDGLDWARRHWDRLSGLATGRGVFDNIAEAYTFLMRHWRGPEDRIYLFGFSRGAFTARAVAGLVNLFGILRPEHENLVPMLVRVYFSRESSAGAWNPFVRLWGWLEGRQRGSHGTASARARQDIADQVRQQFATAEGRAAWVHWVGVWDTVESVGLLGKTNPASATVHDKRFRHVRHALAFDEHRIAFSPRLYEEPGDLPDPECPDPEGRTLRQRWFAGAHTDVGGGQPPAESGLADDALRWMVGELIETAPELGLAPLPIRHNTRLRHDVLHSVPLYALAGMGLRPLAPRIQHPPRQPIEVIAQPGLEPPAASVWQRRRPLGPVLAALLLGLLCLWRSDLQVPNNPAIPPVPLCHLLSGPWAQAGRACDLANAQLAALWHGGLLAGGWQYPQALSKALGWAVVWDFGFILAWGYLLARIGSRAFAHLVGTPRPGDARPGWLWLGLAPMVAVAGDAIENGMLLAAIGLAWLGITWLGAVALWLGGVAALAKFAGLAACLPFGLVRIGLALRGPPKSGGA